MALLYEQLLSRSAMVNICSVRGIKMRKSILKILFVTVALVAGTGVDSLAQENTHPANGKLKIFILAGQSNMVGHGELKDGTGTMEWYLKENPTSTVTL